MGAIRECINCHHLLKLEFLLFFSSPDQINILLAQPGLMAIIVGLLKSDSVRALTGALRTVGNIITGTDEQTTEILNFGVLADLVSPHIPLQLF